MQQGHAHERPRPVVLLFGPEDELVSSHTGKAARATEHRKYDEAELLEVIKPSKERIKPRCEVFGRCGGCSLQHLSVSAQRELKFQTLKDNIQRIGKTSPHEWLDTIHSCKDNGSWNYRRRARLGVKDVKGKNRVLVGFRERYAPYVTDMHECDILGLPVNSLIDPLSELIGSLSIRNKIPQIEVTIAENKIELIFRVLESPNKNDIGCISWSYGCTMFNLQDQTRYEQERSGRQDT